MRRLVVLALVGCTSGLPAPAPGAAPTAPRRGGTLRVSVVDDVRTLDPERAYDEFSTMAVHLVHDTLLGYAPADAPDPTALVPQLAESWSVSADGLTYAFTLRAAAFSDGSPIEAADFVTGLERIRSPEVASPGAGLFRGIDAVRAIDARHLEIRLAAADPSFPLRLAMVFAAPWRAGVSSGPFMVAEWRSGERIVFVRNPHYWDPSLPYLDRIELEVLVPNDVAALKFLAGELDTVDRLRADDYLRVAAAPEWQPYLLRMPLVGVFGDAMNVTRAPFDDVRVRQAFNYAISKEDTVRLLNGRAVAAHGIVPPLLPGYEPTLPEYPHDPGRARALLAAAGHADGLDVTYTTITDEALQLIAQSIQADLAEVGVRVRIQSLTYPSYLAASGRGELDFFYTGWSMDYPDAANFLESLFHTRSISAENSSNVTRWSRPDYDLLLDRAAAELDGGRRLALLRAAERLVHDDCPIVFHYHPVVVELRQPWVMGYRPHPVWLRDYRATWVGRP